MAKILLTEDDNAMANFLTIALEKAGHIVTYATNGNDALNALNENSDFDLLLTDIVMPGIDGIELSKKAQKKHPNIKIMFITGFAAMVTKQQDNTATKNAKLLSKPFHLNELVEQIEQLLSHSK